MEEKVWHVTREALADLIDFLVAEDSVNAICYEWKYLVASLATRYGMGNLLWMDGHGKWMGDAWSADQ